MYTSIHNTQSTLCGYQTAQMIKGHPVQSLRQSLEETLDAYHGCGPCGCPTSAGGAAGVCPFPPPMLLRPACSCALLANLSS